MTTRTKEPRVHSVTAEEEAIRKIKRIKELLESLNIMMGKYESLNSFHYGHVGDLEHIKEELFQLFIFISESED